MSIGRFAAFVCLWAALLAACGGGAPVLVSCRVDFDCGSGKACRGGFCAEAAADACSGKGACEAAAECSTRLCRDHCCAVPCASVLDCAAGESCLNGACSAADVSLCHSNIDCTASPKTPYCDPASTRCVACLDDGDCGDARLVCAGQACQLAPGRCRGADDCPGQFCASDGTCRAVGSCVSAGDCHAPASICDVAKGRCVQCEADAQCPAGDLCTDGLCAPPVAGSLDTTCGPSTPCLATLTCVDDGGGSGRCRASCDLFAAACPVGRACGLVGFDSAGAPLGACLPDAGAKNGEACSASIPCRADLACVADQPSGGRTCRPRCDPDHASASCAAPARCQPFAVRDAKGIPRHFGACLPSGRLFERCSDDAACDAGEVCASDVDGALPTQIANLCRWPAGTKPAVAACDADAECRSGHCLSGAPRSYGSSAATAGFCQGGCNADADCPAANGLPAACGSASFPWYDSTGASVRRNVASCVVQCRADADCRDGASCLPLANATGSSWTRRCLPGNSAASGRLGGAGCTSDDQCFSGVCIVTGTDGFCLGACEPGNAAGCDASAQCPAQGVWQRLPGADLAYDTFDDVFAAAPICWGRACTRDVDCNGLSVDAAAPRSCAADVDPQNENDIVLSCSPRVGALRGGAACVADADCASGWCVPWSKAGVTQKRCFGACTQPTAPTDCVSVPGARSLCSTQLLRAGATRPVALCVPVF